MSDTIEVDLSKDENNANEENHISTVDDIKNTSKSLNRNNQENSTAGKLNWVQFDDDDNHKSNNNTNNINSNSNTIGDISDSSSTKNLDTKSTTPANPQSTETRLPELSAPKASQVSTPSSSTTIDIAPAVLDTESVHVSFNSKTSTPQKSNSNAAVLNETANSSQSSTNTPAPMRTIELSTGRIREGFANGDVIVTLLPVNTRWPWVTPAVFRPELVPEELMAQGLTLTVEEYVNAMETLINDYRFTVYNICYKRVLVCWILFAFCVLLALLFSGLQGIALFSLGVGWLFLNAAAIFFCMWIKLRLSRGLEKCLARVNKQLIRHKILLVLDDRGRISCHKVNLCFLYYDPAQCVTYLNEFIDNHEQNGTTIESGWEARLDLDISDIVIQGNNPTRLSRKQAIAREIFLSYLQRWGKDYLRRRLDWTVDEAGSRERPRHLMSSMCPCQYTEEILTQKLEAQNNKKSCCAPGKFIRSLC